MKPSIDKTNRMTYAQGWKHYPGSCFGHHAQGFLAGLLWWTVIIPLVMMVCYLAYQFGSGARKALAGKIDSVGLDCADWYVGFMAGIGPGAAVLVMLVSHLIR